MAKFSKQTKKRKASRGNDLLDNLDSDTSEESLASQFDNFIWNKACQKMGRPEKSMVNYQMESTAKITAWELELKGIPNKLTKEKTQVRNKIAALRSRMNYKANKGDNVSKDLAGYQSNFKEFIKILSCTKCHNYNELRKRILFEIAQTKP